MEKEAVTELNAQGQKGDSLEKLQIHYRNLIWEKRGEVRALENKLAALDILEADATEFATSYAV